MDTKDTSQPELQANATSNPKKPYGADTQVLVIGVHGTVNGPENVRNLTNMVGNSLRDNYPDGRVVTDSSFAWDAGPGNNGDTRGVASNQLTRHVMSELKDAYRTGQLDPSKPVVIQLVGFSHGGNVALQAADNISEALKNDAKSNGRPLNAAIHVATVSTPAYQGDTANRGAPGEDPVFAASRVNADGVRFAHTHVNVTGDGVVDLIAGGSRTYREPENGGVTRNLILPRFNWNGIDNHGAPQDREEHMRRTVDFIDSRHRNLAPRNNSRIAEAGDLDGTVVAGAPARENSAPASIANANLADARFMIDAPGARDTGTRLGERQTGTGDTMLDIVNDRYFNIGGRQVENPHAETLKKVLDGVQSPEQTPQKSLDIAAALVDAASGKLDLSKDIVAGPGRNGNFYLADGVGDTARTVAVNINDKAIDGAAQRLADATIARAQEPQTIAATPAATIEPDQQKTSPRSMA
jgi:hypothetical protein